MIERYSRNININSTNYKGGYDWINTHIRGVLIEKVCEVSFICLYPKVILKLKENNLLDHVDIDPEIYVKVQYFIDNRLSLKSNLDNYTELKKYVNNIFSKMGSDKSLKVIGLISQYMYQFYDELIQANESNILYIDTDTIFFANDNFDMLDIDLEYDCDTVEMIVFQDRKRYAYVSNDEIKTQGFSSPKKTEEVLRILKEGLRNKKINNLLKG